MGDSPATWQQLGAAMSRFITVELEVGLAFAQAAADAQETREILRNRGIARRAYDMARKMMNRAHMTELEFRALKDRQLHLRSKLCTLGDPCWLPSDGSEAVSRHVRWGA
jgi:hypothetical protein